MQAVAGGNTTANALLWQIEGNGLQKPSYLFGTIHAICPQDFVMPAHVKAKLQEAEQLSLEVDMDAPNFMAEMMQHVKLPEGQSLRTLFSSEDYQLLSEHFSKSTGMNIRYLDNMKPFMLQSLLLAELTDCRAESYEQHLLDMAHAQGKEVIGVETVQEQLQAMDQQSAGAQTAMLLKTLQNLPEAKASYRKMVALYLAQDLQGLTELTRAEMDPEEYTQYEQTFLTNRNKRWIPVMEREAKIHSTFFAVGAGHLAGENGLLNLLRSQGYTITPVQ
ncbi:TraB/GumN family protein [Pontibacter liquoris]|uniref:TraB/GumN family protein n=1 Tax=Pontibacter liquoris TaxID=2905677 RepID=UPI001FA7EC54